MVLVDLESAEVVMEPTTQHGFAWSPDGDWLAVSTGVEIRILGPEREEPAYVLPVRHPPRSALVQDLRNPARYQLPERVVIAFCILLLALVGNILVEGHAPISRSASEGAARSFAQRSSTDISCPAGG